MGLQIGFFIVFALAGIFVGPELKKDNAVTQSAQIVAPEVKSAEEQKTATALQDLNDASVREKKYRDDLKAKQEEIEKYTEQLNELNKKIKESEKLQYELAEQKKIVEQTRKNEEEYKKQIENLSKSNNDLKNQIQKLTDELNSVKSSIDQKSEAKSLSKTDAESKNNSELQKLNDTANQYKKQVEELQAANNNLNKQVEELNATVKSMVNAAGKEAPAAVPVQNEEITANLKQKELEISNLSEINKNLKTELEQIKSKSKEELEKLQTKSKEELEKLAEDNKNIKNELSKLVEQKQVNVKETDKGELQITFSDKVLFSAGQAELKDASKEALNKVIEILNNYPDRRVQVEGHTDNIPFKSNSKYSSNWELSTARAVAVIDYFISKGKISEKRLNVIGWADTKPVADNSTSEGRKLNRRVEILLLNN